MKANLVVPGLIAITLAGLISACASYENQTGVNNTWRQIDLSLFTSGQTTRADVIDLLGPPSQLISLGDGSVLYYLNEHETGRGYVLIVYNRLRQETTFDRAIFFFDEQDVLNDFALSEEINPTVGSAEE